MTWSLVAREGVRDRDQVYFRDLARLLSAKDQDDGLREELWDCTTMYDHVIGEADPDTIFRYSKPASADSSRFRDADLTDWIFSFQARDSSAFGHCLGRWQQTRSPAWLLAALAHSSEATAKGTGLLQAAASISETSPAYLTARFHLLRIHEELGDRSAARDGLDALLSSAALKDIPSSINLFRGLRMLAAPSFDDFIRFAARKPVMVTLQVNFGEAPGFYGEDENGNRPKTGELLDADATHVLNRETPFPVFRILWDDGNRCKKTDPAKPIGSMLVGGRKCKPKIPVWTFPPCEPCQTFRQGRHWERSMPSSAVAAYAFFLVTFGYTFVSSAQSLPPPPPTPTSTCYGCTSGSAGNGSNGNAASRAAAAAAATAAAAQRERDLKHQQEIAKRKEAAEAADSEGLQAGSRDDWEEAANKFMEALELEPDSADILSHLQQANTKLADMETTREISTMCQRIEDTIVAARLEAQRQHLEDEMVARRLAAMDDKLQKQREGLAIRQGRAAAVGEASADCIFDGTKGCTEPVALVQASAGKPPVPADAAQFIERIPKSVRPAVSRDIDLYEHMSSVRGKIQNQMIADQAVANAHPDDDSSKLRVMEESGLLKVAVTDEKEAKKRLVMSIELIQLSPPAGNGTAPGAAMNNGSGR